MLRAHELWSVIQPMEMLGKVACRPSVHWYASTVPSYTLLIQVSSILLRRSISFSSLSCFSHHFLFRSWYSDAFYHRVVVSWFLSDRYGFFAVNVLCEFKGQFQLPKYSPVRLYPFPQMDRWMFTLLTFFIIPCPFSKPSSHPLKL